MDELQDNVAVLTNSSSRNLSTIDLENVRGWSGTPLEEIKRCVHDVVYDQVLVQRDAEAICAHDGTLSYGELDSLSTRLACHLVQAHGIRPETLVPLIFDKGKNNVLAMLAVLKAGAAFVPLDPSAPLPRLKSLFKKVKGSIILCSRAHADNLNPITSNILPIDEESISQLPVFSSYSEHTLPTIHSNNQCYLIFTSGTTGEPKGTVIEHGSFCTSASIFAPKFFMTTQSRVLQFAAHTFDASVLEILATLMYGGCICIPDENTRLNNIVSAINTMRVNWALLTPSFVDFFGPADIPSLRTLVLGGEAMNQSQITTWASHTKLINAYGPSECSVVAVCNNNVTPDTHPLDIGTALAPAFVTDPINHDRLLPIGEIGELLIHGPTLAREYLDNPSQTAESFITNPLWLSQVMSVGNKQLRLYKTGDLVRQNLDGTLRFQGRKDQQIKVHGQRVELGEIEHHVNLNESIKYGLVISPKAGHFKGRLVSVISLKNGVNQHSEFIEVTPLQAETSLAREQLARSLPSYMVPSVWLTVYSIPLLSSGKLDRKKVVQWLEGLSQESYRQIIKLIEMETDVPETNERPATEIEALLRAVWSRVLNLGENQVSLGRSFLSFGGDSISALQVMGHCAKKNVTLTIQDLLRAKSITELARRAKVKNEVAHEEEKLETPFGLSPIQTLFFQRPDYGAGHFNQSFLLRVSSPIQEDNLRSAIEVIIERHSMLRARFSRSQNDGCVQQRITSNVSGSYRMRCHRISAQDQSTPFIADSQKCLDPFNGPIFGADLFDVDGGEQLLFMVCHHLVIDLVSWRVILEEIEEILLNSTQISLGDKPLAFQTWAQLQAEQAASWELNKVLPSQIPAGDSAFWGMENQADTYGNVICEGFEIDAATTSTMLTECHDTLNTEPIDLLISALIYSFAKSFDDRPVPPIFTEGHGREPAGLNVNLSRTVGWFTIMYPQVGSASSDPIETISRVKDYRRRVLHNGRPYFAARCLSSAGNVQFGHHWPTEVTFNYLGQYQQLEREDALLKPVEDFAGEARAAGGIADVGAHTPRFAIFEISAVIVQGKLRFSFTFNRNIRHQERVRHWITECSQAVGTIANALMEMKAQATPTDFPSLSITYEDLRKLNDETLPSLAISSIKEVEDIFPCSNIQTGLFLAQTKDPAFYQDHVICKLQSHTRSNTNATTLAEAWQSVVNRHPALRTIFVEAIGKGDGVYNQLVLKHSPADILTIKCEDQNTAVTTLQQVFSGFPQNSPPHRFTICQTTKGDLFCKIDISHTIIDGRSISLILRDLSLAYEGSLPEGQGPSYSDYIDYLQSLSVTPGLDYWKGYLEGVSPCEFPVLNDGLPVIPKQLHSVQYRVEPEQMLDLQKFCEEKGITFSNLLNAAWALTLRCITGADDVSFGFLSSGRNDAPIDGVELAVGPYINMLVHRSQFFPEGKINDVLQQVQTDYMEGLPYHNTSLADVQHALRLSGRPLFDTSLSYQRSQHTDNETQCEVSFLQVSPTYDPTEFTININIEATETLVDIDLAYWTDKISDGQASNIGSTFLHVLRTIPQQVDQPLSVFNFVSENHHGQLLGWNDTMPPTINECVHLVIEKQTKLRPDAPAICAWDKDFTYAELDETSSLLAAHLSSLDAGPGKFIVSCFDKSAFTIVALMATLKTGAAAVTLDPRFPKSAFENRIRDVNAQIVLASPSRADMFNGIVPHIIEVGQATLDQLSLTQPHPTSIQTQAKPIDPFFVIYTSGSTGEPKGVVLEHRAFMSSSSIFGSHIGIDNDSRVLQFSQYTFDVSLAEIFTTLTRGGCVCVPSEHERYNDLAGAINRMGVNHLNLTPTVAGLLRPEEVPNVKALCLAGEATTKENIEVWGKLASSLYGPSECSVHSTYNGDLTRSIEPTNVGRPTFFNWIVEPDNHNILRPIGCIGDILIEGPLLAREYLNDPKKTAKSFIYDPTWATGSGRRMYKTGDLGRLNSDGTITYIGRRDTQVKLNGQRLELGEIEYHVKKNLPSDITSSVELIKVGGVKPLAAFLCYTAPPLPIALQEEELLPLTESLKETIVSLESSLSRSLPPHMAPTLFIPIKSMPLTPSGKLNRRQLRLWCESLSEARLSEYRLAKKSSRAPSTPMELKLQALWETVLNLPPGSIKADDNFFSRGGDSITCMKLVVAARAKGITMSVADIFQTPVLADFANDNSSLETVEDKAHPVEDLEQFALVSTTVPLTTLLEEVAGICNVPVVEIQDLYPASSLQAGLIALTTKIPGAYVAQNVYRLPTTISMGLFKEAWERVFNEEAILRTRLVQTKDLGLLQAVLHESINWGSLFSLSDLTEDTRQLPSHEGGPLCQFAMIGENTDRPRFVLTAHHALYDGWSLPLLYEKVKTYYDDLEAASPTSIPYSRFINYLVTSDVRESNKFWESTLSETTAIAFPALPNPAYNVQATSRTNITVPVPRGSRSTITMPSTIRAAWALTTSIYSGNSEDVVFGETMTGRDAPIADISHMIGPTISTVPMRIRIEPSLSVDRFLAEVQGKSAAAISFQHAGLQSIKRLNQDTAMACSFQNLLVITTTANETSDLCILESSGTANDTFSSYPLSIICDIIGDRVEVEIHYDQEVISAWLVDKVMGQFEFLLKRLNSNIMMNEEIGQMIILNSKDEVMIQSWNSGSLKISDNCIHDLFKLQVNQQSKKKLAVCSHDGNFTYQELDSLSTRLAQRIVELDPECEILPFCFEKSVWAIVAMLAIMKSGRALVPLDHSAPTSRLRDILNDTKSDLILCSRGHEELCRSLVDKVIIVNQQRIENLGSSTIMLPKCSSSKPAYCIFTSGSTGKPKGTIIGHGAFCTSAAAHGPALRIRSTSRTLQFATYTFDVSLMEILTSLIMGATICVPNEETRLNNIAEFIEEYRVTWAGLTPTLIKSIDPSTVPSLRTLTLGGESMSLGDIELWADKLDLISAYGPSEAAINTSCNQNITVGTNPANIGFATGSLLWVVDANNHDRLAPVGSIGELLIEGPISSGYLNDEEKTSSAFIESPQWSFVDSGSSKRRMYKTGDLVRYDLDGSLLFFKRKDAQKKVHGQRLELGEVELYMSMNDVVQHGLAIVPSSGPLSSRLVAIISLKGLLISSELTTGNFNLINPNNCSAQISAIQDHMCGFLPPYMVPTTWIVLEKLPLLSSGKLDRRQSLKWVENMNDEAYRLISAIETQEDDTIASGLESRLRYIWGEILNLPSEKIGLHKSFLHLGGDSITAMQVQSRCRAEGLGVTVKSILQSKSIPELATRVTVPENQSFAQEDQDVEFDLSPMQKLYLGSIGNENTQFNQSTIFSLSERMNVEVVRRAIDTIARTHSMLRARFVRGNDIWRQKTIPHASSAYRFTSKIIATDSLANLVEQSQKSLDITNGPTFAANLFDVGEEQILSLIAHHLTIDVVSWRVIIRDLEDILNSGDFEVMDALPFQTWCRLQAENNLQSLKKSTFGPTSMPVANLSYWGMENKSNIYADVVTKKFEINERISALLLEGCHVSMKTEPVDVLLGVVIYSLRSVFPHRSQTPTVYNEGHGRNPWSGSSIDVSRTVGWFTTITPVFLPTTVNGSVSLIDIIRWVKELRGRYADKGREYFTHQILSEEKFIMEVSFNYLGKLQQLERRDALLQPYRGVDSTTFDIGSNTARFSLLDISVGVSFGKLHMAIGYNKHMKHQNLLLDFVAKCQSSLEDAAEALLALKPQPTLSEFPLLPLTFGGIQRLSKQLPKLGVESLYGIEDAYKLSPMQQGILLSQQKNPELYNCEFVFEIRPGKGTVVNPAVLAQSWQEIISRHPAMRTVFVDGVCQDGEMGQVVLRAHDADIVQIHAPDDEVCNIWGQQTPFQYSRSRPPHRLTIYNSNTGIIVCKLEISHAISDGTSLPIVFRDLSEIYRSKISQDLALNLPPAPVYSDYIAQISNLTDAGLEYWKSYLDGIQPCHLPATNDGFKGHNRHEHEFLEITEIAPLRDFCTKHGLTLSNILQFAWGLILRLYTASDSVAFGYLSSGRGVPIAGLQSNAVGAFINMLICRIDFSTTNKLIKALRKMQKDFGDAMEHQSCSLAEVQHELKLAGIPLFNTAFTFQKQASPVDTKDNRRLEFDIIETHDPSEYLAVNAVATDFSLGVSFHYWTDTLSNAQAKNMARTFEHILNVIASSSESDILSDIDFLGYHSHRQIMTWNSSLPERIELPIHNLISHQRQLRPSTAQAVCSWGSALTYAELDELASNLAFELIEAGVGSETYVPMCIEKGAWSVVSILAILKAGGAFVPLDVSHPESRLKHIIQDVSAELVLCSPQYQSRFSGIAIKLLAVDSTSILGKANKGIRTLPVVSANHAALVLFTSGTTGVPKGTIIEHGAFCTSAVNHAKGMHINSSSRVLQFANLTFDAGVMEVLTTLIVGGVICIPTDTERMNDISGAIKRMNVNWMFSTPSLASTLDPETLPSLKTLTLGGEAVGPADILKWKRKICVINGYGPSEATICSTANVLLGENGAEIDTGFANIGKAVTGRTWLADPNNHNRLMPIGAIAELVIETRGCARAYLNNDFKTKEAFPGCPTWLEGIQPRERVYKTGDLVRYNSDGSLNFIGRKDSQIKLNGQRIELAEVEHHVKQDDIFSDLDSVVDIVIPKEGTSAITLFFCPKNEAQSSNSPEDVLLKISDDIRSACKTLDSSLASKLPAYMIPSLFIPLSRLPLTSSSRKLDRSKLRNIVSSMSTTALTEYRLADEFNSRAPSTIMERKMQVLWATVLSGVSLISAESSFFRLGGDSIAAMKLVVAARAEGVGLTVADIFRMPTLAELSTYCASKSECFSVDNRPAPEPWTLLSTAPINDILDEAASECKISKSLIHDIYPCSPLQEALITLATKERGAYVAHQIFQLSVDIEMSKFKAACQKVVDAVDILRTRIVHMKSSEFMQIVLNKSPIVWQTSTTITNARNKNMDIPARNGGPLARYTIVHSEGADERYFLLSIQHSLYDGWSLPTVFEMVERAYFDSLTNLPATPYSTFIRYLSEIDHKASDAFWRSALSGVSSLQFPHQISDSNRIRKIAAFSHSTKMARKSTNLDVTIPSIIRAAWSMLLSVYSGSDDVVFGEVLAGRDIPMNGINEIIGPTLTIVPTRIQIDRKTPLSNFLQQIQQTASDVIPHQHAGLQRIKYLNTDTAIACDFQNLLVIQPNGKKSEERLWTPYSDESVQSNFSSYPLMLECETASNEINITAFYDKAVMSSWEVERMILQLDCILQQLNSTADENTLTLGDIQTFSHQDMELVKSWNNNELEVTDRCLHQAFEQNAVSRPSAIAVSSWDGNLTYYELWEHANRLAQHLGNLGIRQNTFVPICMDRSKKVIISIIAILVAGAAYVPLDPKSPPSRQKGIIQDIDAKLILCSPEYSDQFDGLVQTLVVDKQLLNHLGELRTSIASLASSNNPSYVIYTSGSTGKPKGVVIEHKAVATAIWSWRKKIMINSDSRIFHFASLAFDASVMEIFGALTFGGTLCIPSEEQRMSFMIESINSFKATWLFMTPSLANVINPDHVPTLKTLVCGGEALTNETVLKWSKRISLINGFGPTETCVLATINDDIRDPVNIGHTFPSAHSWIADPHDHNRLAPVGCIGELCIEGALSRGYLNNPEKTSESFVTNPKWSTGFENPAAANHSASSNRTRRIYKTGDLVKYSPDGIVFIGRKDNQVKIRGQRIELGEIEYALDNDPHIRHGLVVVPKSGLLQKRLVAVVSMNELIDSAIVTKTCQLVQGERATIARAYVKMAQDSLADQLPRYMVPTTWLVLEAIPISISSKLERTLIQSWVETIDSETYEIALGVEKSKSAPVTGIPKTLQEVVARVLNIPFSQVKMEDSFMGAGGDSISAMQVLALCRKANIHLILPDILRCKTLLELASKATSAEETIYQEEKLDQAFDLSPIQQAYVSMQSNIEKQQGKHFNQSFMLKVTKKVQSEEMKKAVEMLVAQHSMLRARFTQISDVWKQHIIEESSTSYRFREFDLAHENEIPPHVKDSQSCLDIINGPLFAVDVFNVSGHNQILFMTMNHMVVDMVSWRIIIQELEEILTTGSLSAGKPMSFQSWCFMQAENSRKQIEQGIGGALPFNVPPRNLSYWMEDQISNTYGDTECETFSLSEATTKSILGDSNKPLRTEPLDLLLSAIAQSFSAIFFDRSAPAIHNESMGREAWDSSIDLSSTVGWFTTIVPIHVSVDQDSDIINTVRRMKDTRRKIDENGRPYFAYRYLTPQGQEEFKDRQGPVEIMFNYLGRMQQFERQDALLQPFKGETEELSTKLMPDVGDKTARMALIEISAVVIQDKMQFSFVFNRNMKKQAAIRDWIIDCRATLEETVDVLVGIGSVAQFSLSDLPLLPISYDGLQTLVDDTLPTAGIALQTVEDIYPCVPMQEGMLLSQLRDPAVYQFRAIFEVSAPKSVDAGRLAKAWNQVVNRHSALRTIFVDSVYKEDVFNQVVIKNNSEQGAFILCEEKDAIESLESFDSTAEQKNPTLPHKFTVVQSSSGKVFFKLEMNHAIMDGGSLPVLFRDLAAAYDGTLSNEHGPLYSEYVKYLQGQNLDIGVQYWGRYLQDTHACHFPTLNKNSGTKRQLNSIDLKFGRFNELVALCGAKNVTLANIMQAAWGICLRTWTKSEDICWGYLVSGRDVPVENIQNLFGPVLNMIVSRIKFSSKSSLEALVEGMQSDYLESLEHQHCSLAKIQHGLGLGGDNLFNTAVSVQGGGAPGAIESKSISFTAVNAVDPNEYAITLNIGIQQNEEGAVLRYWSDIISDDQANTLVEDLAKVLEAIVSKPKQLVTELVLAGEPKQPVIAQPTVLGEEAQIRMVVKECVQEILGQLFSTETPTYNLSKLLNRQSAQPAASSLPQSMADFSFDKHTENIANKRSLAIAELPAQTNPVAQKLLALWSEYLQIPESSIKSTDSFFSLGADSIVAMQLVSSARDEGLSLSVANIFRYPVFDDMVKVTRTIATADKSKDISQRRRSSLLYQNFSLLDQSDISAFLQDNVCPKIKLFRGGIVDVFPATDFQALSITGSLLESRWLLNYFFLEGSGIVDLKRLRESINQVVDAFEILRTVFIPHNSQFFQVVLQNLNPSFNVEVTDDLDAFTAELQQRDRILGPKLGESYLRFTVAKLRNSDRHRIIMRLSHAQYDGVCLPRIIDALRAAYHGETIPVTPSFSSYVRAAVGKTTSDHYKYWQDLLEGSKMTDLVRRRGPNYSRGPEPPTMLRRVVKIASLSHESVTAATIIKSAWSMTLAELTANSDIIFGNVISGRNGSVPGVGDIVGCCVNIIPVRAKFQAGWTALDLLKHLQAQQTSNMAYESLGFREIIKHCTAWENWSNFTTVCQHQNIPSQQTLPLGSNEYSFGGVGSQDDLAHFTIVSAPRGGEEVEITLTFAPSNIHMTKSTTDDIFNTLCEKAVLFSQNPITILPTPSELDSLPHRLPEDTSIVSARRMSRSLDTLNRKHLLLYSDVLTRGWRDILGEDKNIDSESSFFELGGDIMGMAQLGSLLEGEGFKVKLEDLVHHPVLMEQLALLARDRDVDDESVENDFADSENVDLPRKAKRGMWGSIRKMAKAKGRKRGVSREFGVV